MLGKIPYLSILNYCKEQKDNCQKSLQLADRIKAGRLEPIDLLLQSGSVSAPIQNFFGQDALLIPTPSSKVKTPKDLWVSREICKLLIEKKLASQYDEILERHTSQASASLFNRADQRPKVEDHLKTIRCHQKLLPYKSFILVDDVLTQGRTTAACWLRLKEVYPDADIKIFSLMRSIYFEKNNEELVQIRVGHVELYDSMLTSVK